MSKRFQGFLDFQIVNDQAFQLVLLQYKQHFGMLPQSILLLLLLDWHGNVFDYRSNSNFMIILAIYPGRVIKRSLNNYQYNTTGTLTGTWTFVFFFYVF